MPLYGDFYPVLIFLHALFHNYGNSLSVGFADSSRFARPSGVPEGAKGRSV